MADKELVKKYLDQIENERKTGRATVPPTRLQKGNLLGGKTRAFIEAVKEQGKIVNPKKAPTSAQDDPMGEQSIMRQRVEAAKKARSK
jgi:hypothetical protein